MLGRFRWMIYVALGLLAVILFIGCTRHERREVTVTEEQHESEVREVPPGEMVVE